MRLFKNLFQFGVLGFAAALSGEAAAQSAAGGAYPHAPNILMILTDDVGIDQIRTMGYGGVTAPPTPNIDSIANAGVRFRDMWAMPACSTSRGVLYTGAIPCERISTPRWGRPTSPTR
jgi:hypothetical protein